MVRRFINPSTIQIKKNSYRRSPRRQGTDTAVGHTLAQRHADGWRYAPNAVAHDVRDVTSWPTALRVWAHSWWLLPPWATMADVYFCKICDRPYIFAKS
jgi:hypothetical protein